jgi:hypothetical protein
MKNENRRTKTKSRKRMKPTLTEDKKLLLSALRVWELKNAWR